jgi:excinuclease UvrABC nuclease subunit
VKQIEANSDKVVNEMKEAIDLLNDEVQEHKPKYEIVYIHNKSYRKLWTERPNSQTGDNETVEHLIPIEDD